MCFDGSYPRFSHSKWSWCKHRHHVDPCTCKNLFIPESTQPYVRPCSLSNTDLLTGLPVASGFWPGILFCILYSCLVSNRLAFSKALWFWMNVHSAPACLTVNLVAGLPWLNIPVVMYVSSRTSWQASTNSHKSNQSGWVDSLYCGSCCDLRWIIGLTEDATDFPDDDEHQGSCIRRPY